MLNTLTKKTESFTFILISFLISWSYHSHKNTEHVLMTMVIYTMIYDNDIRKKIEILVNLLLSFSVIIMIKLLVIPSKIKQFTQINVFKKDSCLFL